MKMFPNFSKSPRKFSIPPPRKTAWFAIRITNSFARSPCSEPDVRVTKYENLVVVSEPMSRAAAMTKNNIDTEFGEAERKLLEQAKKSLAKEELVSIDVKVGDGSEGITARLILPKTFRTWPTPARNCSSPP